MLDEITAWRATPLEPVYPPVFLDALSVTIRDEGVVRNKAVHIALGVRADGAKEILGLWLEQTKARPGSPKGAQAFQLTRRRGSLLANSV